MESTLTIMRCAVCDAPLHKWEFTRHTKSCLAIVMPNLVRRYPTGPSAAEIHFNDQQQAWRRNKASGHWVPGKDPQA
jgi:hypothetical protein